MSLLQTLIKIGKVYSLRKSINNSSYLCRCLFRKYSDVPKRIVTFDEVEAQRRAEARRSLVVQVNSESSFNELYTYCSNYATINGVHHYKNSASEHFMLIEFESEDNLKDVLRSCASHQKDPDVMALQSPFLWFRAIPTRNPIKTKCSSSLTTKDGNAMLSEEDLFVQLLKCDTISEQIQFLFDRTKLNDIGVRLRYIVARQLEVIFESLYANVAVRPFGSSVNGFGSMGCDLDLVLSNTLTDEMSNPTKRLIYQEKKCEGGRSPWQRHLELVGEVLELRVPGATRVQRIVNARVPILKYAHIYTGLDCDLSYNNLSGVQMSALMWSLGTLEGRLRPLTLAVRRWARAVDLTSPHPGRWITSFPLSLMVIFFLQRTRPVLLPPLKNLLNQGETSTLRDLNDIEADTGLGNSANLEELLLKLFEFYAQFDFERAISVVEGDSVRKPNNSPLYIVNPLDKALNVSRNVSFEECERLKMEVRNAAWQLEGGDLNRGSSWGLSALLEPRSARSLNKLLRVGNSHRLVSVKDLFEANDDAPTPNMIRTKLEKIKSSVKGKFKNEQIAREVYRIRRNKVL